ncbi:MAG: zinc ribbon domain-containing protein [Lachnospira eligens]
MFCPNCGTKNEDDALFCGNCGTRLVIDVPQETPVRKVWKKSQRKHRYGRMCQQSQRKHRVRESVTAEPEVTPVQQSVPVQPQQAFGQQHVQPTQFTGQNSGQQPANNKPARFPKV